MHLDNRSMRSVNFGWERRVSEESITWRQRRIVDGRLVGWMVCVPLERADVMASVIRHQRRLVKPFGL